MKAKYLKNQQGVSMIVEVIAIALVIAVVSLVVVKVQQARNSEAARRNGCVTHGHTTVCNFRNVGNGSNGQNGQNGSNGSNGQNGIGSNNTRGTSTNNSTVTQGTSNSSVTPACVITNGVRQNC